MFLFILTLSSGVTKKIVSVVSSMEDIILDDSAQYLKPTDPLPLFSEEEQAVVLMRSFCPQQSTPDPLVGTCIAQGFGNCLPDTSPPVLTQSGVVRGDQAKLPQHGIESFVKQHVVRSVVFKNAEEYHTVIAPCRRLTMDDLLHEIYSTILEEDRLVFLLKWWTKYSRVDPRRAGSDGNTLKEAIRYYPVSELNKPVEQTQVVALKELLFYVDKDSHLAKNGLPIPESVIDLKLQEKIGESTFSDVALRGWFSQLPMEIWAEFISHHKCMTQGKPEDSRMRLHVLAALSKEYNKRSTSERSIFGGFLASVLGDKRCVPFEISSAVTQSVEYVADRPCDLYLSSAELKAFDGVGSFRKVSSVLSGAGVTDDFLLDLGVRKSVSVDFLFASLDTLNWSCDPKPLVEYLRSATLTKADLQKLSRSQYLPAENDNSRTYAPSELYLPNEDLRIFPFVKMLLWPSEGELSDRSENGRFLVKLGMRIKPPLAQILAYITDDIKDDDSRLKCLDFVAERLGARGIYHDEYASMNFAMRRQFRIIPSIARDPLVKGRTNSELRSPVASYSDQDCAVMGFPVVDPALGERAKLFGAAFQCPKEPDSHLLLKLLLNLTTKAKELQKSAAAADKDEVSMQIESAFKEIFKYLSQRSADFSMSAVSSLKRESFIPCRVDGAIEWFQPDQVFFRRSDGGSDKLTEELFHVVEFSPFLSAVGGKCDRKKFAYYEK